MNKSDPIQLPGLRQLLTAFIVLVLLLLAFDSVLQWLNLGLHRHSLIAPELLFPMSWLSVLF